jgi:hypothetical protein
MPHILHLVKDPANPAALEVIARQAGDPGMRVTVVLLQDAARLRLPLPGRVYRLDGDSDGSPAESSHPPLTHAALLDLIFEADTVVTW